MLKSMGTNGCLDGKKYTFINEMFIKMEILYYSITKRSFHKKLPHSQKHIIV